MRNVERQRRVCIPSEGVGVIDGRHSHTGSSGNRRWESIRPLWGSPPQTHVKRDARCLRSVGTPSPLRCAFAAACRGIEGVVAPCTPWTHATMRMHARPPARTEAHLKANSGFEPLPVAINKADERNWGVCQFLCTLDDLIKLRACGGVQNGTVFESLQTFLFIRGDGRRGHRIATTTDGCVKAKGEEFQSEPSHSPNAKSRHVQIISTSMHNSTSPTTLAYSRCATLCGSVGLCGSSVWCCV